MEDLDQYNGDAEHDMWVDFDYHEHTGELSVYFFAGAKGQADYDDSDLNAYVENLNDRD